MKEFILSEDQGDVYNLIAKWVSDGGVVSKEQKDPLLLTLAGYAGTGKTTLVSLLAKHFGGVVRFAFCALSGRASSILGNKLREHGVDLSEGGHYCGTIHRLIYRPIENDNGEIIHWARNKSIDYDVIILDEASMISENIFYDLASYSVPILAVGDHGQLPPIEGRFSLMHNPILKLEKIHRQAEGNPIINLSMNIRKYGKIPDNFSDNENINIIKKQDYIDFLKNTYEKVYGPHDILKTAVLCYKNATRSKLNMMVRRMVYGTYSATPFLNDIVICLKNVNNREGPLLYNGFRGYFISDINEDDHFYGAKIHFPSEDIKTYVPMMCKHQFGYSKTFSSFDEPRSFGMKVRNWGDVGLLFDFGYALTVHKCQGSSMEHVILFNERPAPVSDEQYKRWLYTAVTRASNKVTIIL